MPGKNISTDTALPETVGCLPANCELNKSTNNGGIRSARNAKPFRVRYRNSFRTTAATTGDSRRKPSVPSSFLPAGRATTDIGAAVSLSSSPRYWAAKRSHNSALNSST